jgi:hypothetical protein
MRQRCRGGKLQALLFCSCPKVPPGLRMSQHCTAHVDTLSILELPKVCLGKDLQPKTQTYVMLLCVTNKWQEQQLKLGWLM